MKLVYLGCFMLWLTGCTNSFLADVNLAYRHQNTVAQADFQHGQVSAVTFNNQLLLTGIVPNESAKQQAEQSAAETPGVKTVFNYLAVGDPITPEEAYKDNWLTVKVVSQLLLTEQIDPKKIKVVTSDGVVYIMAIVDGQEANAIYNAATHMPGVRKVIPLFTHVYYATGSPYGDPMQGPFGFILDGY